MTTQGLTKLLIDNKILTEDKLSQFEKDWIPSQNNISWEDFLLEKKAITEAQLLEIRAKDSGVPIIDLHDQEIEPEVLDLIPEPLAHRHRVISFAKTDNELSLAMTDPSDIQIKEFIKKKTGLEIKPFATSKSSLDFGLSKYHSNLEGEIQHLVDKGQEGEDAAAENGTPNANEQLQKMAAEIPVVQVVDTLLEYAVIEKASDIHIEPQETTVAVRYRIDGVLHDVMTLPKAIQAALVARIKVLSNLKIDEHRLPQDGRFKIEKNGYKFSLRVSTIPIFDGEKVVMRLLDETTKAMSLEALGFLPSQLEIVTRNIHKPHGMLLVTGPTGSGKSTTLYAVLSILNTKNVNISTIEDPVEYRIVGANQMQVNPKIGLTFAVGLRALLRQDPNVIMIGEIRDKETAEEAMHAAMTGHIVLSTLHTNSAAASPPRLIDIGEEPYLISSTLNVVMAQRLVRLICTECKVEQKVTPEVSETLSKVFNLEKLIPAMKREGVIDDKVKAFTDMTFYAGKGCEKCSNTGYKGRIGIHEILEVTPEIGELIIKHASSQEIQDLAEQQHDMILIWQDGFIKAAKGMTTIEEILRVTKE
ncbi:MAG: type II/IV secretion system protein [Candidatus Doudnabacteria bacterium]|nr:type II/IV secretion system protein [Candidatus Doudnabacteria bacterium]